MGGTVCCKSTTGKESVLQRSDRPAKRGRKEIKGTIDHEEGKRPLETVETA